MAEGHNSVRNTSKWMPKNALVALFVGYLIFVVKVESKTTVSIGILFDVLSLHHHGTLFASLAELNHNDPEINLRPVIATVDIADSFAVSNAMCDLISQDIIAIIGITNSSSLSTIQSYSNTFNIPFISIGSTHNFTLPSPFQIYLRPAYMGAVVDILDFYHYTKALYIYDTDEGLMRLQDVFQYLNNQELLVDLDVRRVSELDQLSDIVQPGKGGDEDVNVIILDVNSLDVHNVVKYLKGTVSNRFNLHLITITVDQLSLDAIPSIIDREMNITGFQLVPPDRFHRNKLFPDTFQGDILSSSDALIVDAIKLVRLAVEVAQEEEWFPRLWSSFPPALNKDTFKCSNFIVEKKPYGSLFMECLTRVNFYGKTGPVILDDLLKRRKYILGVYQFRNGNRALKLGIWDPENGLKLSPQVQDRTYTLIVNASKYSIPNVPNLNVYRK